MKPIEYRSMLMALMDRHQRVAQMMIDVARDHNIARFHGCIDLVADRSRSRARLTALGSEIILDSVQQ